VFDTSYSRDFFLFKVFTGIYTAEAVMKLIVLSPKFYFEERRNIFDFIIVLLSHLELLLGDQNPPGTSALRILRLVKKNGKR